MPDDERDERVPFPGDEREAPVAEAPEVEANDSEPEDDSLSDEKSISQKELDRILQKRLKRQEDQLLKKYGDYDTIKADAEAYRKLADEKATDNERWEKRIAALEAEKVSAAEELTKLQRTNLVADLATDAGLPKSFWKRVSGDNSDEIEEDIASIISDLGITKDSKETTPDKTPAKKVVKKVYGGGGETESPDPDIDSVVAKIPRGPQFRIDPPRSYR